MVAFYLHSEFVYVLYFKLYFNCIFNISLRLICFTCLKFFLCLCMFDALCFFCVMLTFGIKMNSGPANHFKWPEA